MVHGAAVPGVCRARRHQPARKKREGDGATPAGIHRLVGMLYRPDRLTRPADWALPMGPCDLWSDDPRDPDYNLLVRAPIGSGMSVCAAPTRSMIWSS